MMGAFLVAAELVSQYSRERTFFCSLVFEATFPVSPLECGGDDGARTRDLCRDSRWGTRNFKKLNATDGYFWRY